jgi:hypothetical protein
MSETHRWAPPRNVGRVTVTTVSVWTVGIAFSGSNSSLESLEGTCARLAVLMRGEMAKAEPRAVTCVLQVRSHVAGGENLLNRDEMG